MSLTAPIADANAVTRREPGLLFRAGLWGAQVVVALVFCFAGYTKLMTPIAQLAAMMPWTGSVSEAFVRCIGVIDLAGGLGLLLPSLTRILPKLTLLAASCCIVLQILAAAFHLTRGEAAVLPLNGLLLILLAFILWGRATKAPIRPRD